MKKLLWIVCLGLTFTCFAACGGKKDKKPSPSTSTSSNGDDLEAGGAYNPKWDNEHELTDDYFD